MKSRNWNKTEAQKQPENKFDKGERNVSEVQPLCPQKPCL